MKELPEYVAKGYLREHGVPTPEGTVVSRERPYEGGPSPSVVKAQVPVLGRGKQGGIAFADDEAAVESSVRQMLGGTVGDYEVEEILVEARHDVDRELYAAIAVDGSERLPELVFSHRGGADIEDVPSEAVYRHEFDPLIGPRAHHLHEAVSALDMSADALPVSEIASVLAAVWTLARDLDLKLAELNPLGVLGDEILALDAKFVFDGAAGFRHPDLTLHSTLSPLEQRAADNGITLRTGDGSVGIVSNGAGLGMATLDLVAERTSGMFAGFIDTHGAQFGREDVPRFLEYLREAGATTVVVNIVGTFLDCRPVANGLVDAVEDGFAAPIVVRLGGMYDAEALDHCAAHGLRTATDVGQLPEVVDALLGGDS